MTFDDQMGRGGLLFWAVTAASTVGAYLALWALMAMPDLVGVTQ